MPKLGALAEKHTLLSAQGHFIRFPVPLYESQICSTNTSLKVQEEPHYRYDAYIRLSVVMLICVTSEQQGAVLNGCQGTQEGG